MSPRVAFLVAALAGVASASAARLPSPTCALNGLPCPPPTWEPTWNLTQSTIIQPGGANPFVPSHPWGLISLDWSVGENVWFKGKNTKNTTCEATSTANCRALKSAGLAHRCFIYHNMELALEWLETQRAVMYDPTYSGYFLQYQAGNPKGQPAGTIYNEAREEGDQFFWDFRNASASAYFISSVLSSLSDPAVDGTFTDDVTGVPAEHPEVQKSCGYSDSDISALQYATQSASAALISTLTLAGKYNYQAFGAQDGVNGAPSKGNCAAWVRERCAPAFQGYPMFIGMDNSPANANQTVAAFLVVRPPHGYIGWGWESGDERWNDIFYLQAGEPLGLCVEGPANVFSRQWTAGTATIDCNQWTGSLPFPALAH